MPAADEPPDRCPDDEDASAGAGEGDAGVEARGDTAAAGGSEAAGTTEQDDEREDEHDDRTMLIRIALFVAFFVALLGVRAFVVEPVRVHADSMAPTLQGGDALLIDKLTYRFRDPHRGEIVITHDPISGDSIVKRVVAVGGDSVGIEDGFLVLNGEIVDEPYADLDQMDGYFYGPITVPDGHVFLLGDHRFESSDSRQFGPVPVDDIDGRKLLRFWPL